MIQTYTQTHPHSDTHNRTLRHTHTNTQTHTTWQPQWKELLRDGTFRKIMTSRRYRHLIRQAGSGLSPMELRRWKTAEHLGNALNKGNEARGHRRCRHGDHHAGFLLILLDSSSLSPACSPVPRTTPQTAPSSLSLALTPRPSHHRRSLRHQRASRCRPAHLHPVDLSAPPSRCTRANCTTVAHYVTVTCAPPAPNQGVRAALAISV